MKRYVVVLVTLAAPISAAQADAWMVKSSTLGCKDREVLVGLDSAGGAQASDGVPPEGCVLLDTGERLLDQPQAGGGFDDYMKLQRRDSSMVFVRSSAVVPDPGIGSVFEDR